MCALSLLAQCLPGLAPEQVGLSVSTASDKETHLPQPTVEIVPSKVFHTIQSVEQLTLWILAYFLNVNLCVQLQMEHPNNCHKYAGESIDLQGVNISKVRQFSLFLYDSVDI